MTRLRPTALVLAGSLAVAPWLAAPAAADDEPRAERVIAWGGLSLEASMAAVMAINFGTDWVPNHGPGLIVNFTPLVLAPLTGYLMRDVDADPAYALHGAAWGGLGLFLAGALIDGRGERDRLKVGRTAWTLGAVGALAGGVVGATQVGTGTESTGWMVAPPAGFAAGGVVLGTLLVLIGGLDGDRALSQWTTGAVVGVALGAGVGTYLVLRDPGDAASRGTAGPIVDAGGGRTLFSVGGQF